MKRIYFDYSATTYVDERVKKEMNRYFSKEFGNPSSFHDYGLKAKLAVDEARNKIKSIINADFPEEIIFTGSGTESINLAIQGLAREKKSGHIITTKVEHHSVLDTCKFLGSQNFEVTYLDVDQYGLVSPEQVEKAIKSNTILISIIYANNEIGTINSISEIGKVAKKYNIPFHTDACQAGLLNLNVKELNVDFLTINGSKIYGPKGTAILYKKKNIKIQPLLFGGGQEFNLRSGTENVPGIVGIAKALELIQQNKEEESRRLINLRDKAVKEILKIQDTKLNGHQTQRLPHNINISFLNIEGESLILLLNAKGICASTGSACTSQSLEPSHVITAIGAPFELAHGSLRLTLGRKTTEKEIDYLLKILPKVVKKLRKISPFKLKIDEI